MTRPRLGRGWFSRGATLAASTVALAGVLGGCGPLEYCTPPACSLTPDANRPDAGTDADVDADVDAGMDAGMDAGPPPIAPPYDGTTLPPHVCTLDGWCWLSPGGPPDGVWTDVARVDTSEVWVVTDDESGGATPGGAILRYDGTRWRGLVGVAARRVAGSASNDVWFLANDHDVFAWDGASFTSRAITDAFFVNAIASAGPTDVWAVGDAGRVMRFDGTSWTRFDAGVGFTTDLRAVYAAGADDIWIAGDGGVIRHLQRSGTDWAPASPATADAPSGFDVAAIWALTDASTVWIGGPSGARYWDGTTWATPTGTPAANITAIAGTTASDVYLLSSDANDFRAFGTTLSSLVDGAPDCALSAVAPFDTGRYLRVGRRLAPTTLACPMALQTLVTSGEQGTSPIEGPFGAVASVEPLTMGAHAGELLVYAADGARVGMPDTLAFGDVDATLVPTGMAAADVVVEASHGATDLWVDAHDSANVSHLASGAWTSVAVAAGVTGPTDVLFATDSDATWAALGPQVYRWVGPDFVAHGTALPDDIEQIAATAGVVWVLHAGGTALSRLDTADTWTDVALDASWPADCAPLVARDASTVECLAGSGRYRATLAGTFGPVPTTSDATLQVAFTATDGRALAGDHGWLVPAGATGDRILWPQALDEWQPRSAGVAGPSLMRMLADGTTWRVVGGSLLEWRPR